MTNNMIKDEIKHITKSQEGKQRTSQYKGIKNKIGGLKDAMFESRAVKCAAQFTMMLEGIIEYIQIKYNNNVARVNRDVE